jgi:hypothetical protein
MSERKVTKHIGKAYFAAKILSGKIENNIGNATSPNVRAILIQLNHFV